MKRPPVLFIHGAFSKAAHFAGWKNLFTQAGYECAAPDLPGHDHDDPQTLTALTFDDYEAALRLALAKLPSPPVIIGHSMGGLLAQRLATTAPASALVCVAAAPPWMLPPQPAALPYLVPLIPAILAGRALRAPERTLRALAIGDLPESEQRTLLPTFGPESGKAYRAMILGLVHVPRTAFSGPVLCLSGRRDRIIPQRTSAAIARHYDATHRSFDCGHWLIAPSREPEIAAGALRWVEETVSGRAEREV